MLQKVCMGAEPGPGRGSKPFLIFLDVYSWTRLGMFILTKCKSPTRRWCCGQKKSILTTAISGCHKHSKIYQRPQRLHWHTSPYYQSGITTKLELCDSQRLNPVYDHQGACCLAANQRIHRPNVKQCNGFRIAVNTDLYMCPCNMDLCMRNFIRS